jgi:membrane protein required for colicin V production
VNWLDIILVIFLLIGLYKGFLNGFFVELASMIALVAAVYGSLYFSDFAGNYLRQELYWEETYISIASFAVTFLIIIIAITLAGKLLTKIINTAQLGLLNQFAGAVLGLAKVVFLASLLLMFANTAASEIDVLRNARERSLCYYYLEPVAPFVLPYIIEQAEEIDDYIRDDQEES